MKIIEIAQDTVHLEMHADDAQNLALCCRAAQGSPAEARWAGLHNDLVSSLASLFEAAAFGCWALQFVRTEEEGRATYSGMRRDLDTLAEPGPLARDAESSYNGAKNDETPVGTGASRGADGGLHS